MEVVEEILARPTTNNGLMNTTSNTYENRNAMILAAISDAISLDGLFCLIRRHPEKQC